MSIRAKFRVTQKSQNTFAHAVDLQPVTHGSDENKSFYKATPGGQISLEVVSPEIAAQFELGKEYYIDFTPAES